MAITSWWKHRLRRPFSEKAAPARTFSLEPILVVSRAVAASQDLEPVLEAVHQQVGQIFDTTNFYIATYDGKKDEWTMVYHLEHGERQPVLRHKLEAGLTGYVIRNRRSLLLHTTQEVLDIHHQLGITPMGELCESWMGVPIVVGEQVLGVIAIQSYTQQHLYGEQDLQLFTAIAAQVAIAVENARLYKESHRWVEEMALLQEISHMLGQTLDLHAAKEALIQGLQRLIPHEGGELYLYDAQRQLFTAETTLGELAQVSFAESCGLGEGYTGWLGRERKPLRIGDCAAFTAVRPNKTDVVDSGQIRSYLGVPILSGDRLVGALEVVSSRPDAFDQNHQELLTLVAAQTAAAVERARLFEELSNRLQEARLLFQVSQSILGTLNLDQILDMIVRACVDALPNAEKGSLHLVDETGQALRIRAAVGYSREVIETVRIPLGQPYAGQVAQKGEPIIVDDTRKSPLSLRAGLNEVEEIRSLICVPLRVRDQPIGVISIDNLHQPHAFRQEDLEILSALAGQAALAIENANLYGQMRLQVEQLRRLGEQVLQASSEAQGLVKSSAEMIAALEDRSRAIGDFVAQLAQFAEQTDLLALNAAIEAARAGEHGLGFAVVAEEVRHLAESSAQAAAGIATLSREIIAETRRSVQQMEQVQEAVGKTTELALEGTF